jgi:hypothetical protein
MTIIQRAFEIARSGKARSIVFKKPALVRGGTGLKTKASIPAVSGRCHLRRHRDELGHLAEVLGSGSEEELILGAVWSS